MTDPTPAQVLATPLRANASEADTIGGYLAEMLYQQWNHFEGLNGKRPFGESGWKTDIYVGLIDAGHITGTVDDDGIPDDYDPEDVDRLVLSAFGLLEREVTD